MATIKALSSYKHADHFNKRVVEKTKREDTEEKEEHKKEVATVVKEIQAKKVDEAIPATEATPSTKPVVKKVIKKSETK